MRGSEREGRREGGREGGDRERTGTEREGESGSQIAGSSILEVPQHGGGRRCPDTAMARTRARCRSGSPRCPWRGCIPARQRPGRTARSPPGCRDRVPWGRAAARCGEPRRLSERAPLAASFSCPRGAGTLRKRTRARDRARAPLLAAARPPPRRRRVCHLTLPGRTGSAEQQDIRALRRELLGRAEHNALDQRRGSRRSPRICRRRPESRRNGVVQHLIGAPRQLRPCAAAPSQ